MDTVYVSGHRNPDTDSIVSAMAYASMQNQLGSGDWVPVRLGPVTDETQRILDRFGFDPPREMRTVRTQVSDLDFDTPPSLGLAAPLDHAWQTLRDNDIQALPVTDDAGRLFGILTRGDIAAFDMESVRNPWLERMPLFSLLGTLEAQLFAGGSDTDWISGRVVIALPGTPSAALDVREDSIVITSASPDVVRDACEKRVRCLVLCKAQPDALEGLDALPFPVLLTQLDAYRASRMIFQAIPVERVCCHKNLVSFHLTDFVDDVRDAMLNSRFRSYPILDAEGKVAGTLSRFHLIRPRRKRVVLVDHNETSQSIPGLEQAEILAVIDHHRLADVQTAGPVYFLNEPVGATTTIIARMYQERGLMPTANMAGLMAAAILTDTVLFKSPTCTQTDRDMARRLAHIAGVSLDELGASIFSVAQGEGKTVSQLFMADYKEFHLAGHALAISQITCSDAQEILQHREEFLELMAKLRQDRQFNMVLLMITDVLKVGTYLIFQGDEGIIRQAFGVETAQSMTYLPGVVSRKKQVVPMLSVLWG